MVAEPHGDMSNKKEKTIHQLIDYNVRAMLQEMTDRPPSERESLAGAIHRLLQAKPLASEGKMDLLSVLQNLGKGPKPTPATPKEK